MRFPLKGKVVLLTGASSGIGEGLALELGRRGALLALGSRGLEATENTARRAQAAGSPQALALRLDVEDAASVERFVKMATKEFGRVDALVNNAGVHLIGKVEDLPADLWMKAYQTNVLGVLRLVQAVLPQMKAQGSGLIVQISSLLALRALPGVGGYSASKAALNRLTEALRLEVKAHGIQVLNIMPGVVKTPLRLHSLHLGEPPTSMGLPFSRSVEATAREIADAMQSGKREILTAAWPAKFAMKWLSLAFPSFVDKRMADVNPTHNND